MSILLEAANYGRSMSEHRVYRHGCIITPKKGSRMRYYGTNRLKTTPGSPKPFKTICAEFDAVLNASRHGVEDFSKYVIYVARYGRDGTIRNSKPCQWCSDMIKKLKFKKAVWS